MSPTETSELEKVKEVDPKYEAKKAQIREAKTRIRGFMAAGKGIATEKVSALIADLALVVGTGTRGGGGGGGSRVKKMDVIADMFKKVKTVSENTIWEEHKLGRIEMRYICVDLIKRREPEDRIWISFRPDEETYVKMGVGPEAPNNWTGYKPVQIEEIEVT